MKIILLIYTEFIYLNKIIKFVEQINKKCELNKCLIQNVANKRVVYTE